MGRNGAGEVSEVNRKYCDQDVCWLFLTGLCPHELFQKMDVGPCPKVHSLQLRKEYEEAKAKGLRNLNRRLEDNVGRLIGECEREIQRAFKNLKDEDAKAAIAISLSKVTQSPDILEFSKQIKENLKEVVALDLEMKFTQYERRKLLSCICREEEMLNKKRRWLMESPTILQDAQKRSKVPKFLRNVSLPESFLRSDDVFFQTVRTSLERNFRSFIGNQEGLHVVQDYLHLFDTHYSAHPFHIIKTFSSALNDLTSGALCLVANIVTEYKVRFERTRPTMKKVILENLPEILTQWNCKDDYEPMKQLSQIFRNPNNFRNNQMALLTPVSPSAMSSISKALERLDDLPSQALIAMDRKLKGVAIVPRFPPVNCFGRRVDLVKNVRKMCDKIIRKLKDGEDLPKPFAKALSVVCLSLKQKTGREDIPTSEFFPFPPEIEALQNDILKAIWSLPKVKLNELKALQLLVDPNAIIPGKALRKAFLGYLMEYLFECHEINIPELFLRILASINKGSHHQLHFCIKDVIKEEVEVVLNVSCQLRQFVWDSFPDHSFDQEFANAYKESSVSGDGVSDDINLASGDYFSALGESGHLQSYGPCLDDKAEVTGESRGTDSPPVITAIDFSSSRLLEENQSITSESKVKPKQMQKAYINGLESCPGVSIQSHSQNSLLRTKNTSPNLYLTVQDICDETSLVAHRLIGRLMEEILLTEGTGVDAAARSYLRGGKSPTTDFQDSEKLINSLEKRLWFLFELLKS